jgi:DNA-binding SARP family transcriptional activator
VSGLRRCLGESLADRLKSPDGGHSYMFGAAPGEVDVMRFDELATQGRAAWYANDPCRAAALLADAAGLWRDPALRDVPDTPILADLRAALIRGRADVQDLLMDARLALGGHHEAIVELRETLARDRHREHVWAQLMLALYRDGRRTEALLAFADARAAVRAELGCEPGPWLTLIYHQIAGDRIGLSPAAGPRATGTRPGPLAQAWTAQPWPASARSWPG